MIFILNIFLIPVPMTLISKTLINLIGNVPNYSYAGQLFDKQWINNDKQRYEKKN